MTLRGYSSKMDSERRSRSISGWTPADHPKITLAAVILLLLVFGGYLSIRYDPPPIVGVEVPSHAFSGERAFERLQAILPQADPHPLGSPANDRVRSRILKEFKDLGLDPIQNDHWVSSRSSTKGTSLALARNLLVELPSSNPDLPAILLACHYDSVAAGPGASDDAAAVASLIEIASILMRETPLARPVFLLFTDGEEVGLVGARGFVRFNEIADQIGVVINLEARGNSGGSLMFETSEGNSWLVEQMAQGLDRPMSSSAYVSIYRAMPNSSDLTVFMKRGLSGLNFAFIGNPKQYHTPLDDTGNLDLGSLQHQGNHALAMTRQLLLSEWTDPSSRRDAIYTDLGAHFILSWPAGRSPWLAGAILLSIALSFLFAGNAHCWQTQELLRGGVCWALIILLGVIVGWLSATTLQHLDSTPTPWPDRFHFDLLVPSLVAAMSTLAIVVIIRTDPIIFYFLHGIALALGSLILSLMAEGFSYVLILPAFMASLASFLLAGNNRRPRLLLPVCCLLLAAATSLVVVPFIKFLPPALGVFAAPPLISFLVVLLLLPLTPLISSVARPHIVGLCFLLLAGAVGAGYAALQSPCFSPDAPQQINLTYFESSHRNDAQIALSTWEGDIPPTLTRTLDPFPDADEIPYPLGPSLFTAPKAKLASPDLELLKWNTTKQSHRATIRLRPTIVSQEIQIRIHQAEGLSRVTALGMDIPLPEPDVNGQQSLLFRGVPEDGLEITLAWTSGPSLALSLIGITPNVPPQLKGLRANRDQAPACPAHEGDRSITLRQMTLSSPLF